jgi:cytochrome b6-f complex iron-sulfur subunit
MNTRRHLLGIVALWLSGVSALIALLGAFNMLIPRIRTNKYKIKIGTPSDYPISKYTFIPEANIFLFRERKGVKALSAICTHLGCTLIQSSNGFRCPCHGSSFDYKGHVVTGPAPKGLSWYKLSKNWDGTLFVHKDKRVNAQYLFTKL